MQSATVTVFDTTAKFSPSAFINAIVTSLLAGPGFATTSSTSTPVSLGSNGLKLCCALFRFVHALFQGSVFDWSWRQERMRCVRIAQRVQHES